ncbi:MAG: class I SAM-dependent methyltransferase, partial [Bacteroidota bacterium]
MRIKSYLSGLLRKMNLLSSAEKVRFNLQKLRYKKDNHDFRKEHTDFVLTPECFIYETYRLNYKWYYEDGKNSAEEIVALLSKYFDFSIPQNKVLDWGCGPGRIVRHLPCLLQYSEIFGTDYNENYIQWCQYHLPQIEFFQNSINPPMSFSNSFFDIVLGLSIFTHLSEKNHHQWIGELYRVVKLGGVVLITTQGDAFRSKLTAYEKELFD